MFRLLIILCFFCERGAIHSQSNYCQNIIRNTEYHERAMEILQNQKENGFATIYIPVVFHIVYNKAIENVPDSLIVKQLNTLNNDFTRRNRDTADTPRAFRSAANKMHIQFCFASRTPTNQITNGINRVSTKHTFFDAPPNYTTRDSLKHTNLGGADAWDANKYLNIWVANVRNVSGYAAPPTNFIISEDGVGVNYQTLGTNNATPPYNAGRTVTHEVGHFFGLRHIWGDDGGTCAGTDFMADTPNQSDFTSAGRACNLFPLLDNCTPAGNGVMFMNYMDYSKDICRNMFTTAQCDYMLAVITCCRPGFLHTSNSDCGVVTDLDLHSTDNLHFSIYPNPGSDKIKIEGITIPNTIEIINLYGEQMIKEQGKNQIDVSSLKPNVYLFKINGVVMKKFIKK